MYAANSMTLFLKQLLLNKLLKETPWSYEPQKYYILFGFNSIIWGAAEKPDGFQYNGT